MKKVALLFMLLALASCKRGPEPWETATNAGNKAVKDGDFEAAATQYEKSLELKPDQDPKGYDRAAFARMKARQFDQAAALLEKSLQYRSGDDEKLTTYRNIAGMYLQQASDLDNAEKYFKKAMEVDPKDEQSLSWLAEIESIRGGARVQTAAAQPEHLKLAIERYDQLIAMNPGKPDAYVNKRIALVKLINQLLDQKKSILADVETQKDDKQAVADLKQQADDTQKHVDELKATLDETAKKLGEVMKTAKPKK